jgi:hypothetical protein
MDETDQIKKIELNNLVDKTKNERPASARVIVQGMETNPTQGDIN